jgi:hypothetical protein
LAFLTRDAGWLKKQIAPQGALIQIKTSDGDLWLLPDGKFQSADPA